MTTSHFGHSEFATSIAMGPPRVCPCRTPPLIETASCSNFMRAPLPAPSRRRASSSWISELFTSMPAGNPSMIAVSAGPWDSPAVSQRSRSTMCVSCQTQAIGAVTTTPSAMNGPNGMALRLRWPSKGTHDRAKRRNEALRKAMNVPHQINPHPSQPRYSPITDAYLTSPMPMPPKTCARKYKSTNAAAPSAAASKRSHESCAAAKLVKPMSEITNVVNTRGFGSRWHLKSQ